MDLSIVFLALYDNSHGRYVLRELIRTGPKPTAVCIGSTQALLRHRYRSVLRYLRANGAREMMHRLIDRAFKRRDVLPSASGDLPPPIATQAQMNHIPILYFDNINDEEMVQRIKGYQPDFLVLGGAPLVKRAILSIPRHGVLNAHPAKLPEIRGMDVVGWSILERVPLGITVFVVDEGIDTGPILHFVEVQIPAGLSLEDIEQRIQSQAGLATVEALQGFVDGRLHPVVQKKADGKLYRAMPKTIRRQVDKQLRGQRRDSRD